jgi:hypothetical protein
MPNGDHPGYSERDHYRIAVMHIADKMAEVSDEKGQEIIRKLLIDIDVKKRSIVKEQKKLIDRENQRKVALAKLTDEEKKLIGAR